LIAEELGLATRQVEEALAYFDAHREEILVHIDRDEHLSEQMQMNTETRG